MKKSTLTQELANAFPPWSKISKDHQSLGQQAINSIAVPMERMEKQLITLGKNQYLSTANLNEIDLTYRVELSTSFEFDEDTTDPLFPCPQAPTVSGEQDSVWHDLTIANDNDIESFWYSSIPNRVSLAEVVSGEDDVLLSLDADETPASGEWNHHLNGGHIYVECTGGVQYLTFSDNTVRRGHIILEGETRKGTEETETLVFPWDQKQRTLKEFSVINKVSVFDIEDDVGIVVRSGDFNSGPYVSPWNLRYSQNRNKIDEFWDVGHNGTIPTLDRIEYISDEWQQQVLGFSSTQTVERWELLENAENVVSGEDITVSGEDLTIEPFSDRLWVVSQDSLYCYDLMDTTISGVDELIDNTAGGDVQFDFETDQVVLGEDIVFAPWHARPIKELISYRLWYQLPDGTQYGLLDGAAVSITSNHTVKIPLGTKLGRTITEYITIPTTQRGEYVIGFEGTFVDGSTQTLKRIFSVKYKTPLVKLDLSSIVPENITGVDFDSDQKLWVQTTSGAYYRINLHTDVMLIDYENKIIYLKENYDQVGISTDG